MELEKFEELMKFYGEQIDITFEKSHIEQFYKYMNLLIEWNEKINLTAIIEPEEIILKHFIDSLTICKYIENNATLADVGTGAGFPGIPLKIYRPDIKITLVDSLNKRINFLNEVINNLELKNIVTIHSRVEDFGKNKNYREKYDYVTARAVANLNTLSEYLVPIVKVNGKAICMKGNDVQDEVDNAKHAIKILGGTVEKVDYFKLPNSDISRNIIVVKKVNNTPARFPRKAGMPSKEPLV